VTRALLFDLGGTLDADGLTWKERFSRLFRDAGVSVAADRFDPVFYAADDALVGTVPTSLSLRETATRVAAGVARGLGIADADVAVGIAERFVDDALATSRRNVPLLARLAARYRLGLVSNFYGNLVTVCDDMAIRPFFGAIVDSVRAGCVKPDPRIFRQAVEELGVSPVASTFVGDSLTRDMAGARAAGMAHVWLAPETADGKPCCAGDHVIRTLLDLEALLGDA
jgi:putative hydrolase of the HAD superfamily